MRAHVYVAFWRDQARHDALSRLTLPREFASAAARDGRDVKVWKNPFRSLAAP